MAHPELIHVNDPIPLWGPRPSQRHSGPHARSAGVGGARVLARRGAAFDHALDELTDSQRRVLRLLLTGARASLVADVSGEARADLANWLGRDQIYHRVIEAAQSGLPPTAQADLFSLIVTELAEQDEDELDAGARATLSIIRALGRLDADTDCLAHSRLRADRWDTSPP